MSLRTTLLTLILVPLVFVGFELSWRAVRVATPTEDTTLSLRTIIDHQVFGDVVRYTYLGEQLPETLTPEEVVGMRTETSYSRLVTLDDETATVETISYLQKTFAQDLYGVWYYAEYATTTIEAFEARSVLHQVRRGLARAFLPVVYAVTDTIYSVAGGDGYIDATDSASAPNHTTCQNNAFAGARGATVGTINSTATTFVVESSMSSFFDGEENLWFCDAYIARGFLPFDTSTIPASASISAASLNVYVTAKTNGDNDGTDYLTVIETSQASHSSLVGADYDNVGVTEGVDSGQRKDITSISTSAYLTFTLNSTGIGFIKVNGVDAPCSATNGISCFGLREGHDITASPIVTNTINSVTSSSADHTGTTQDPYLSVTYTVPAAVVLRHDVFWFD